mmetsp:Transcript_111580/g.216084  ORF Transcript_111580/g.216084 Transcript_111580/m.216084 type:complete len:259 (+) Transcript_111580:71-847(+)|eukprot:CAMPEP_0172885378 /NCGR_PEP_ID=MMETSP1075-20121228/127896_1 /TAXON_ID=2916 /ORGANISM="Ceratium fusus, Strain PA161109" /LENGTH=258 /DNA_ID=CAMNT_0013738657 /DNA_START=1 /DNA_END=777 /DNA_ORIENTATION=-
MAMFLRLGLRTGSMAVAAAGLTKVTAFPIQHKPFLHCDEDGTKSVRTLQRTRSSVVERSRSGKVDKQDTVLFVAYKKKYGDKKKIQLTLTDVRALLADVGLKHEILANRIFKCMDDDDSGTVDFQEMSAFCNLLAKGTEEDKFKFLFNACDVSDSGNIDIGEMRTMIKEMALTCHELYPEWSMVRTEVDADLWAHMDSDVVAQLYANRLAHDVFVQADKDKSGGLSLKEFIFWAKRGGKTVDAFFELFPIFSVFLKQS